MAFIFRAVTKFIKYGMISTAGLAAVAVSTKPSIASFDSFLKQSYKNASYDTNLLMDLSVGFVSTTIKQKHLDMVLYQEMTIKTGEKEDRLIGAFNTWFLLDDQDSPRLGYKN